MHPHQDPGALALLMDIRLPVQISLGRTRLPLAELMRLAPGAVVELDGEVSGAVEIMVHDRVIATGEIVDVEGNYGIRILSRPKAAGAEIAALPAGTEPNER